MKKLLLIVNPTSGIKRGQKQLLSIVESFCKADFLVSVHTTRYRLDATNFVRQYGKNFDILVACGGDGTLNEVISGALSIEFAGDVGFIPCGTTNDLATSLGIPKTPLKAAELIAKSRARFLDLGSFNKNRFFTYIASFGAFTEVSYSTDQSLKNSLGHLAYIAEGIATVSDIKPYHMRVVADGKAIEGDYIFGAAANALSIGGILKLHQRDVDLTDGKHELLLVRNPKNAADLASLFGNVISGNYDSPNIVFLHAENITFLSDEEVSWTLDGEFGARTNRVEIQNLHNRLKVYRP